MYTFYLILDLPQRTGACAASTHRNQGSHARLNTSPARRAGVNTLARSLGALGLTTPSFSLALTDMCCPLPEPHILAGKQMRLLYSALFKTGSQAAGKEGPVILSSAKELSSFSYFQRNSINEMFTFFSRTFANQKNLAPGARTSVKQQQFQCHMYVSPFGVTAVCFADDEYPARVAFGYLSKLCDDFWQAAGAQLTPSMEDNCMGSLFQVRCSHRRLCSSPDYGRAMIHLTDPPCCAHRRGTQSCWYSSRIHPRQIS